MVFTLYCFSFVTLLARRSDPLQKASKREWSSVREGLPSCPFCCRFHVSLRPRAQWNWVYKGKKTYASHTHPNICDPISVSWIHSSLFPLRVTLVFSFPDFFILVSTFPVEKYTMYRRPLEYRVKIDISKRLLIANLVTSPRHKHSYILTYVYIHNLLARTPMNEVYTQIIARA